MARDKDVFVMGEEVGEYQGAYKVWGVWGGCSLKTMTVLCCILPVLHYTCVMSMSSYMCIYLCTFHSSQITRGLLQKYGHDRVRDTPITEVCMAVCMNIYRK